MKTIKLYVLDIGGVTVERDWERHQGNKQEERE